MYVLAQPPPAMGASADVMSFLLPPHFAMAPQSPPACTLLNMSIHGTCIRFIVASNSGLHIMGTCDERSPSAQCVCQGGSALFGV